MRSIPVTPFNQGEPQTFTTLLCDGYRLDNAPSLRALLEVMREKAPLHPGARLFATLDDFPQASYTSGHATDLHQLDDTAGYDLSGLDPEAFENGEHRGYLSTKSEFFIRHGNLSRKAAALRFEDARGKMLWGVDGWDRDFFELNEPAPNLLDREIYVQIVPVAHAYETICAFPNGYFHGDLTPMEIFAVARRFEELYRYELFGIGASYVGFRRAEELPDNAAPDLAEDFLSLYSERQPAEVKERIIGVIRNADYLLFNYTGH
jgi:hypothetical protein